MYDTNAQIADRREMLRVKVKSLAEEARIIRKEEQRIRGSLRYLLAEHRRKDVRKEARSAHLAYGFILGRTLEEMERKSYRPPDWDRVARLCRKYGPTGFTIPKAA